MSPTKKKVGFIGLGVMGKPMAKNVLKAGFPLTVFDAVKEPVDELVKLGAKAAASPKELAGVCDTVVLMVANAAQINQVVLGPNGVKEGISKGKTIIIMSTIEPTVVKSIADVMSASGVRLIDSPVSPGQAAAEAGTLRLLVGGEKAVIDDCREVLLSMGKDILLCGDVGQGEAVKLINNFITLTTSLLLGEAFVLGVKCGLKADRLFEILTGGSANTWILQNMWGPKVLKRDFSPGFQIDLALKDVGLAISTAKDLRVPMPIGALCQQLYQAGSSSGKGKQDFSAMINFLEDMAGVQVKGEK